MITFDAKARLAYELARDRRVFWQEFVSFYGTMAVVIPGFLWLLRHSGPL